MEKSGSEVKKIALSTVDASKKPVKRRPLKGLAKSIKEGAIANSERDLKLAREWFWIEEEIWKEED